MSIKSFIYLDQYKMYSISSQIFEGLTEYITNYRSKSNEETDSQKGPHFSGRVMADIIKNQTSSEERRFLHDYSYTLFEKELIETDKVVSINPNENSNKNISELVDKSFIKITGKAIFSDIEVLKHISRNLQRIGQAFTAITKQDEITVFSNSLNAKYQQGLNSNNLENRKKTVAKMKDEVSDFISDLSKKSGFPIDQNYYDNLEYILNFGLKDQFEIQIPFENNNNKIIFSADLNRDFLKENETILLRKYARYTEKELVIFGIITQCGSSNSRGAEEDITNAGLKNTIRSLTPKLMDIEKEFSGRLNNEVIIDPIAVYREL